MRKFLKQISPWGPLLLIAASAVPAVYALAAMFTVVAPDLMIYWVSAGLAKDGISPYDWGAAGDVTQYRFNYPPFALLLFLPFSLLPFDLTMLVWRTLWVAAPAALLAYVGLTAVLRRGARSRREAWLLAAAIITATVLSTPVLSAWHLGQVGVALTAIAAWDLIREHGWKVGRWRIPQGILIGLAGAIKITPLIAVPYWWVTGHRRAAITATVTAAASWCVGLLVWPADSIRYFVLGGLFRAGSVDAQGQHLVQGDNLSVSALIMRITGTLTPPSVVVYAALAVTAAAGVWAATAAHRRGSPLSAAVLLGLTSVLVAPISWIHHAVWLVLAAPAILAADPRSPKRRWIAALVASAAMVASPTWTWSPLWKTGAVGDNYWTILTIATAIAVLALVPRPPRRPTLPPLTAERI